MAGIQYATAAYSQGSNYQQEEPSYGQGSSEGQESDGYRQLRAPADTIDTRRNRITHTGRITLWIVFIIFFLSGWYFFSRSWAFYEGADDNGNSVANTDARIYAFLSDPAQGAGVICLIAALA